MDESEVMRKKQIVPRQGCNTIGASIIRIYKGFGDMLEYMDAVVHGPQQLEKGFEECYFCYSKVDVGIRRIGD